MAAHAAMPHRRRRSSERQHHSPAAWALPVTLGVLLGLWAAFIERAENDGVATGNQWILGGMTAVVLAALLFALMRVQHALPRELRALAHGALTAATVGFLISIAGGSVLRAAGIGVAVGAGMAAIAFYFYYTRE